MLDALIARLLEKGRYEGFRAEKKRFVFILQFEDITLIFCKFDDVMMENLHSTIELFEWCFGKKINLEKSALSWH